MRISLNPSDHASRGLITATARSVIIWRGPGKDVPEALKLGADCLHVHSADAPVIKQAFEKAGHQVRVMT